MGKLEKTARQANRPESLNENLVETETERTDRVGQGELIGDSERSEHLEPGLGVATDTLVYIKSWTTVFSITLIHSFCDFCSVIIGTSHMISKTFF